MVIFFVAIPVYVGDMVLIGSYPSLYHLFKDYLHRCFNLKDSGPLKYVHVVEVACYSKGVFYVSKNASRSYTYPRVVCLMPNRSVFPRGNNMRSLLMKETLFFIPLNIEVKFGGLFISPLRGQKSSILLICLVASHKILDTSLECCYRMPPYECCTI